MPEKEMIHSVVEAFKSVERPASTGPQAGRPEKAGKFHIVGSPALHVWCKALPWLRNDGNTMYRILSIARHTACKLVQVHRTQQFDCRDQSFMHDILS